MEFTESSREYYGRVACVYIQKSCEIMRVSSLLGTSVEFPVNVVVMNLFCCVGIKGTSSQLLVLSVAIPQIVYA